MYDVSAFATAEDINLENLKQDLVEQDLYEELEMPSGKEKRNIDQCVVY